MTIVTTTTSSGPYTAVAQTTFAVTFQSAGAGEIEVTLGGVVQSPSLYTFTRSADGTGSVVFITAVTGQVLIYSKPNFDQPTSFSRFGAFYPDQINSPLDKASAKTLYLKNLLVPASTSPADRASKYLSTDASGNPVWAASTKGDPGGNAMAIGLFTAAGTLTIPTGTDLVQTSGNTSVGVGGATYIYDAAVDAAYVTANPNSSFRNVTTGRGYRLAEPANLKVEQTGAVPGEANSTERIMDAFTYARVQGGGKVSLTPGKTYKLNTYASRTMGTSFVWGTGAAALSIPDKVFFDGTGAWLQKNTADTLPTVNFSAADLNFNAGLGVPDQVTAAPIGVTYTASTTAFPLSTVGAAANYTVGDLCFYQLGSIAYDTPETYNWGFGRVTAINTGTNTVTLDTRLNFAWDGTGNRSLWRVKENDSPVIGNINMLSEPGGTQNSPGLNVRFMRNVRGGAVVGVGMSSVLTVQYVDGFHFDYVSNRDTTNVAANRSLGMRVAEARGYIAVCDFSNLYSQSISVEGASDLTVGYWREIDGPGRATPRKMLVANGRSRLHIESAHITTQGYVTVMEELANDINQITFGDVVIDTSLASTFFYSIPRPGRSCQNLELNIAGVKERYPAALARWHEEVIWLDDSATIDRYGPAGCVVEAEVEMLGGAVQGNVTEFYLGRGGGTGSDIKSQLPAASSTATYPMNAYGLSASTWGDGFGATSFAQRAQNVRARVVTTSGGSLAGSGKGIRIRWLVIPDQYAANTAGSDPVAGDYLQTQVLEGKKTFDFGSIAAGAVSSTTVTVTGAAVGDFASVSFSVNPDTKLTCTVGAAAGTVTVALFNPTAGAIVGPNATVRVSTRKPRLGN